jgi:transcriptional regulator with XRE-family HTH domain
MSALARRLREFREEKGITQEELEKILRLERSGLSRIERGKRGVSLKALKRIAKATGIPPGELL